MKTGTVRKLIFLSGFYKCLGIDFTFFRVRISAVKNNPAS